MGWKKQFSSVVNSFSLPSLIWESVLYSHRLPDLPFSSIRKKKNMTSVHHTPHSRWNNTINFIVLCILVNLLVSCMSATPSSIPTDIAVAQSSSTPTIQTIATHQSIATPTTIVVPTLSSELQPLNTDKIVSVPLGKDGASSLAIDDDYIYWIGWTNNGYISRISTKGGKPEKIATSTYPNGRLDLFTPILSGKWLIFADTNTQGDPDTWKIRVLNLEDHTERVVWEIKNDTTGLIYSFAIAADGDTLVWVVGLPETSEDGITMFNMTTGEKREVLREKVNGSLWSFISLSHGQAVIEKDFDENNGGGADIYSLDLTTGKTQALSTDQNSDVPHFAYPWVTWKAGPRYDTATKVGLYNLQTQQKGLINLQGIEPSDPLLNNTHIYWKAWTSTTTDNTGNAIYMYDIIKNTIFKFDTDAFGPNQRFDAIAMHGELIAWSRVINTSDPNSDSYLEWATIK